MLVALVAAILIVALIIPVVFLTWVTWAWKTQERTTLRIENDDAEIRLLFAAYCAAVQKAIEAAKESPRPLEGKALKHFLEAEAEAADVVQRIKAIRAPRDP